MNFKKRVNGSWHDIPHYIHKTSTDTITTLPAVIYPNDTTATVGLKGQTVQNGTPTPDNPIMPQETGERTGNLFDGILYEGFYDNSGQLVIDTSHACHTNLIKADTQTAYTVSNLWRTAPNFAVYEWDANKQWLRRTNRQGPSSNKITFTLSNDCVYFSLQITSNYDYTRLMLNTGSTPLPYEPFGYKIPISSAGLTTPVYLGEVESTRRIKKLVLDGTENYSFDSERSQITFTVVNGQRCVLYCSHYIGKLVNSWSELGNGYIAFHPTNSTIIRICDTTITSVADFKAYLAAQYAAGTPVTVWYVLATPETAVVNEPLMKIGDYADEVSGITIPVTTGGDTISVDTTLQPSEMSATYKGWHPAIVHERTNGAWT